MANLVLGGGVVFCVGVLLYCLYHYGWTQDRHFANALGPVIFYIVPATVAGLLTASLWLKPSHRINLALLLVSAGASIYGLELALTLLAEDERVRLAKDFGVDFDTRSVLEVIRDLEDHNVPAVPNVFPLQLFKNQNDGTVRADVTINGTEILPLGGIANRPTVFCRESGEYVIYDSDEHGFHNPRGLWDVERADVLAVGDSFAEGFCVPSEKNFVALIRKQYPATLTVGKTGNGPLIELAALKEYVPLLKPKVVLWFYFEGNDLADLTNETRSPLLMSYLKDNISRGLLKEQAAIDRALIAYVERERNAQNSRWLDSAKTIIKFSNLRSRLGLDLGSYEEGARTFSESELALFGRILSDARAVVGKWGGALYFVYLPSRESYAGAIVNSAGQDTLVGRKNFRDLVLATVRAINVPIIDIHVAFRAQADPLALFPFRRSVHYNEEGNRLVAEDVLRSMSVSN